MTTDTKNIVNLDLKKDPKILNLILSLNKNISLLKLYFSLYSEPDFINTIRMLIN